MLPQPLILGLGVPKAATTWIHRQLEAHPEISVTTTKELGYWSRHYDKGPDWYRQQFAVKPECSIFAEFTPHYLNKKSLTRIADKVKDGRFILALRNPFERAYSEYLHERRNGEITGSFAEACSTRPHIVWNSLYGDKLSMYLKHFSLDQLHIIFFEDIKSDPIGTTQNLYKFIGVRDFLPRNASQRVNVGRDKSLADLCLKKLERIAKHMGVTRKHLRALHMDVAIEKFQARLARKKPKPESIEMRFLEDILRPDIETFSRLVGKDFSHWNSNNLSSENRQMANLMESPHKPVTS